jgi:hypothetical protein
MKREYIVQPAAAYCTAHAIVATSVKFKLTWEENLQKLTESLSMFNGNDLYVKKLRKEILHCRHDDISFEDFVFLGLGPLEFGLYYDVSHNIKQRASRAQIRMEMINALQKIVNYPEFSDWTYQNRGPIVTLGFASEILGNDFDHKKWVPIGYLKALYRVRMYYEKWKHTEQLGRLESVFRVCPSFLQGLSLTDWVVFLSDQFDKRAKEKCARLGHLDHWKDQNTDNTTSPIQSARMEKIDLDDKAKVFVVRNAMSPEFVAEMKREINRVPFMAYAPRATASKKYDERRIRITSEKPSHFLMGKGTKIEAYASTEMVAFERKLLQSMNALLAEYSELFTKVLGIKVRLADQLQEVKDVLHNGGYGPHNDQSALCCRMAGENIEDRDPDRPEFMIVATYVLSNIQDSNTKVTWRNVAGKERTAETSDNDIHFQAFYCQTSHVHSVKAKVKGNKASPNDYRVVFSARATMHFQQDQEMINNRTLLHMFGTRHNQTEEDLPCVRRDYKFLNVLCDMRRHLPMISNGLGSEKDVRDKPIQSRTKRGKRKLTHDDHDEESNCPARKPTAKRTKKTGILESGKERMQMTSVTLFSDTYANAPHDAQDPVRPTNPVIVEEPFYKLALSDKFYKPQLREGFYYDVMCDRKDEVVQQFGPFLVNGKLAEVGELFETSDIEAFLGLSHGGKEGSLCWNPDHLNGILIKHAYKNDVINIQEILTTKKQYLFGWV